MHLTLLLAGSLFAQSQGTVVVYVDNQKERSQVGDGVMDTAIGYMFSRYEATLSKAGVRRKFFRGQDFASGAMKAYWEELAKTDGPIDFITLSHSGGESIETPCGTKNVRRFFEQMPDSLKPRLRLFYNAGCYGGRAWEAAFEKGFVASIGTKSLSIGPLALDEFLIHYTAGAHVTEAARRINASVRGSSNWTAVMTGWKLGMRQDRDAYADMSPFEVRGATAEGVIVRLATTQAELDAMRAAKQEVAQADTNSPPAAQRYITELTVRAVGDKLPTRLGASFDGTYLPDQVEVDVLEPDVTKLRWSAVKAADNAVLTYERDVDRGIQHELEVVRVNVPVVSYSEMVGPILTRVASTADLETGWRHRPGNNTGYVQAHLRTEASVGVERAVDLAAAADVWTSVENRGVICDAELSCSARVWLNQEGAKLEAGWSRFWSDFTHKRDELDAFLIGFRAGR